MKTNKLILSALFIAISIVLTRFMSFYIPIGGSTTVRAGMGHIPIILAGIFLGPLAGALVGGISDVLGVFLFSPFPPFPGFTLSSILLGLLSGLAVRLMRKTPLSFKNIVLLVFIVEIPCSMFLNTKFASMLYGVSFSYLFPVRVVSTIIFSILYSVIIYALYTRLVKLDYIKKLS